MRHPRACFFMQVLVGRLVDMGFSRPQAEDALMKSGGDPDLAAEQLMTQVCARVSFAYHVFLFFFVSRHLTTVADALNNCFSNPSQPRRRRAMPSVEQFRFDHDYRVPTLLTTFVETAAMRGT